MVVFNYRKVVEVDRFLSQNNFETGIFDLKEVE